MVTIIMRVPENKRYHGALFPATCSAATVLLLLSPCSDAGEWRVIPRMSLIETYSDNVRLGTASSSSGSGDLITQVNPGVSVSGLGPRFNLRMDYTMNNLFYAENSNLTRTRQQLDAMGTAELVEDLFFVDGRATISSKISR